MKYVFTGTYTQFMGRMFAFGKPQDITDRATLEAIRKRSDFKEYVEVADVPVPKVTPSPEACRKCGKAIGTGRYMHEKYCKG